MRILIMYWFESYSQLVLLSYVLVCQVVNASAHYVWVCQVAVCRCDKIFTVDETEANEKNNNKDERAKRLTDWALDGFKPSGPEAFEVIKG